MFIQKFGRPEHIIGTERHEMHHVRVGKVRKYYLIYFWRSLTSQTSSREDKGNAGKVRRSRKINVSWRERIIREYAHAQLVIIFGHIWLQVWERYDNGDIHYSTRLASWPKYFIIHAWRDRDSCWFHVPEIRQEIGSVQASLGRSPTYWKGNTSPSSRRITLLALILMVCMREEKES